MTIELRDLNKKVICITGASSGIGRATARELVQEGALVSLGARRMDRLENLVKELGEQNAIAIPLDVTDVKQCKNFIKKTVEHFGRLDSVVANAGIGFYGGVNDLNEQDINQMIQVNFAGTIWTVQSAIPEFRKQKQGDIIIISSVAGFRGGANEAVYAGTKFAQVGFAGSIDRELQPEGIRVTTICPAGTNTEFAIGAGRNEGDPLLEEYLTPEDVAFQVITTLKQPRRLRTSTWSLLSMNQSS